MAEATLAIDGDTLRLSGRFDIDTVAECQRAGKQLLLKMDSNPVRLNFKDAEVVGTGALLLIISWQRFLACKGVSLGVLDAPEALKKVAEISGVADIIQFDISP